MSVSKSLCFCCFLISFGVAALNAQSIATSQTMISGISGSDQAAAASTTRFVYRIVPAATPAAKKLPPTALTNKKLVSSGALPKPGFYPADLSYHGGPVVQTAE